MLAGREDVQADLLGLLGDDDGGPDAFCLAGSAARRRVGRHVTDGEDPELHARHSSDPSVTCLWTRTRYSGRDDVPSQPEAAGSDYVTQSVRGVPGKVPAESVAPLEQQSEGMCRFQPTVIRTSWALTRVEGRGDPTIADVWDPKAWTY